MARSFIDLSIVDSTSNLLSDLNLTSSPQNMESVNSEDFMEVPDTPDRLSMDSSDPLSDKRFLHFRRSDCKLGMDNGNIKNVRAQRSHDFRISDSVNENSEKEGVISNGYVSDGVKRPELSFPKINRSLSKRTLRTKRSEDQTVMDVCTGFPIETRPRLPLPIGKTNASSSNRPNLGSQADLVLPQMFTPTSGKNQFPAVASDVKMQDGNRLEMIDLISPDYPCYVGDTHARRKMHLSDGSLNTGSNQCVEISPDALTCQDETRSFNLAPRHEFTRKLETRSKVPEASDKHIEVCMSRNCGDVNIEEKFRDNGKGVVVHDVSQSEFKETVSNRLEPITSLRPITSPRPTLRRRMLVRNGFISPDNIARSNERSDELNGHHKEVRNDKQDTDGTDCNQNDKGKGKGIIEDNALADEFHLAAQSSSSRKGLLPSEEVSSAGQTTGDTSRSVEEFGGWRSTRNRAKRTSVLSANAINGSSKSDDGLSYSFDQCHENILEDRNYGTDELNFHDEIGTSYPTRNGAHLNPIRAISSTVSDSDPEKERRFRRAQKLTKRQRNFNLSARDHLGECSSSNIDDSEVSYLHSSRKASNGNLTRRVHGSQNRGRLEPVIEVDNLCSPEQRSISPIEGTSSTHIPSDNSSAKARQVEADEILARQLQEQFYDELPEVGDAEINASVAYTLQQVENARRSTSTSIRNRGFPHPRDSSIAHLYRDYPLESFRNSVRSSSRVGSSSGGGRLPASMRMTQLRRSFRGRSPTRPSAGRRFPFPSSMDLDTRIHLLEALEAGFGENNERAIHHLFLQVERDFNEDDYEMLLALDDDNDRHGGASLDQINRLPLSIVPTDDFEEACAVCLETPSAGDSIRHLPCLHKFHKECIDPWLGRRPLCPICKSSII